MTARQFDDLPRAVARLQRRADALERRRNIGVPTGTILATGRATAPGGYVLCQGQAISRTTFAVLFAAIGTAYGVGDGSTTFNVPNLQQRFPLGKASAGTGSTLGGTGGTIDHAHTQPTHTHTLSSHTHAVSGTTSSDAHSHTVDIAAFNSGGSSSNAIAVEDNGTTFSYATGAHIHSINPPNTATTSDAHTHTFSDTSGGPSNNTSGADGNDATGTANPPFQVVNYMIKT